MSDDDDDGWGECDAVISCELFARNQAVDLLDQLADGIAILDNRTDD